MKEVRIKDICDKGSSNLKQKDVEGSKGKYPVYGASGIISSVDFYHQDNDYIAIVKDGSGIGRVSFMPAKSSVIGTMQYILPHKEYDIKYISYCLQSLDLSAYKQGAAIPHIYFRDYGERIVKVTEDRVEQQQIVDFLDAEFAKIDELKNQAEQSLQNAKDLFQVALKEMLTPKEGWKEYNLEDVCEKIVDCPHSTPPKSEVPTQYPFIRTSELRGGKIFWDSMQYLNEEEYNKRIARIKPVYGDIIYGREGTYGDAAKIPETPSFCLGQRVVLFRPKYDIVDSDFFVYELISPTVFDQAKSKNLGCGVGHVNVADIKKFKVFFPSLEKQIDIVDYMKDIDNKTNTLQSNYSCTIQLCADLKQALLRQVFE